MGIQLTFTCNRLMESKLVKRGESQLTTFRQPIMSEYRTRSIRHAGGFVVCPGMFNSLECKSSTDLMEVRVSNDAGLPSRGVV